MITNITPSEVLRIIAFLKGLREPFDTQTIFGEPDPVWNIVLFLMETHLRGVPVTIGNLAAASGLPHGTAMRRIGRMVREGLIVRIPKGAGMKTYHLRPSANLIADFLSYCFRVKTLFARTIGQRQERDAAEFYLGGGGVGAGREIVAPGDLGNRLSESHSRLRFMVNDDNFFVSMRNLWSDYRARLGSISDFSVVSLYDLHSRVRAELKQPRGRFEVVAIDNPWLGELVSEGLLQPLDHLIAGGSINPGNFNPAVWATGNWNGVQYGIPIYTTMEVLAARSDLFAEIGLAYPRTFDKTVEAAARLHRPSRGIYGIGWNCAPGLPIASTFMILLGCCGVPLLNYPIGRRNYDWSQLSGDQLRPNILSREGRIVLDYMHRLMPYSPPNILELDWHGRLEAFLAGQLAMTYCWSMRAARFEYDISSHVKRKVSYLAQPKGPGGVSANPVGGFHLVIPSNIPAAKAKLAFEAIAWLAQPGSRGSSGYPVAPRFSTAADPEVSQSVQVFSFADSLAKKGLACSSQRPPIPEYTHIEAILGNVIHAAMRGDMSDEQALTEAQNRVDAVMRAAGRY